MNVETGFWPVTVCEPEVVSFSGWMTQTESQRASPGRHETVWDTSNFPLIQKRQEEKGDSCSHHIINRVFIWCVPETHFQTTRHRTKLLNINVTVLSDKTLAILATVKCGYWFNWLLCVERTFYKVLANLGPDNGWTDNAIRFLNWNCWQKFLQFHILFHMYWLIILSLILTDPGTFIH